MRLTVLALVLTMGCNGDDDYVFDPSTIENNGDGDGNGNNDVEELVAKDDDAEVIAGEQIEIDLTDNDDGDGLEIINVSAPDAGGAVEISGRRDVLYTADLAFSGEETFTYTVEDDAGQTATATVFVDVLPRPILEITSPDNGANEEGPTVLVSFEVRNCSITAPSADGAACHIHMYIDGAGYNGEDNGRGHYNPDPRELFAIPSGTHEIAFRLAKNDGTDDEFAPEISDTITVTLP